MNHNSEFQKKLATFEAVKAEVEAFVAADGDLKSSSAGPLSIRFLKVTNDMWVAAGAADGACMPEEKLYLCIQHVATVTDGGPIAGVPITGLVSTSRNIEAAFKFSSREEAERDLAEALPLLNSSHPNFAWRVEENLPWHVVSAIEKA